MIWRMVDPISIVAKSGEPGWMRARNEMWVVNFCEIGKEDSRFLIFGERKVFAVGHHAHDMYCSGRAVLEIAARRGVGVEEATSEFLIDHRDGRRLRSVGETHIAPREQRGLDSGEVSGRDMIGRKHQRPGWKASSRWFVERRHRER